MIDVEHRSLRTFKEHFASTGDFIVQVARGVRYVRCQTITKTTITVENLLIIQVLVL